MLRPEALLMESQGGWNQFKEFLDIAMSIGKSWSKAEEDHIVHCEVNSLRHRISGPNVPRSKMNEFLIRLIYVEMLGHDAPFGDIHAIKMAHDNSLRLKRTGYLAVNMFLKEDHDLIILIIINTIQKDLSFDR